MRKQAIAAALVLAVFGLAACGDEESTGPEEETEELVGTWVSTGNDVALGLQAAPFSVDSIIATFQENGTYEVLQYSGGVAQAVTLTGTYVLGNQEEGQIRDITVTQTAPFAATSQGIFQITGTTMQYEIIQVEPALQGVNPPTVSGGFGSTTVAGTPTGVYWVQNYDRRS